MAISQRLKVVSQIEDRLDKLSRAELLYVQQLVSDRIQEAIEAPRNHGSVPVPDDIEEE